MIDNRKRKRNNEPIINKYDFPDYSNDIISEKTYKDVKQRNDKSIFFKSEFKMVKDEEILYDVTNFEIYYVKNPTKYKSKSSPERYVYIDQINSEKSFFIQCVITSPRNSKYYGKLVVVEISEYSLQYGDRSEWSLWVRVIDDEWFRLLEPFESYQKYFAPMLYRFNVVMYTTQLFDVRDKKSINYRKVEKLLEKNFKDYNKDDIIYFRKDVFKHVCSFLNMSPNHEVLQSLEKEMKNRIAEIENTDTSAQFKEIDTLIFTPPQPSISFDKISNDVKKEIKKLKAEMKATFDRRILAENNNEINDEAYEDVDEDKNEKYNEKLDSNNIKLLAFKIDKKKFKEEYLGVKKIPGNKMNKHFNYDFDFNLDEIPEPKTRDREEFFERLRNENENESIQDKEKYIIKKDILQFSKLPKETITYKIYDSLFSITDNQITIKKFDFDLESNPNEDLIPFLVCRVCGYAKHIVGANCELESQRVDKEISNSIQEYIVHLESHRLEILNSMSKKQRDTIDKTLIFNHHLNRSRIETIEANALKQLFCETTQQLSPTESSFYFAWP